MSIKFALLVKLEYIWDFTILLQSEKTCQTTFSMEGSGDFQRTIEEASLQELEIIGLVFTWTCGVVERFKARRLDRTLVNEAWKGLWSSK